MSRRNTRCFLKGVIAKLSDTARDAVSGLAINSVDNLKDALKEFFAPKKTYNIASKFKALE